MALFYLENQLAKITTAATLIDFYICFDRDIII